MDFIPEVTRLDVVRVVARDFPEAQRSSVLSFLDQYSSEAGSGDPSRTHLAILKLSGGDIDRVRDMVALAQQDFRDVIAPAEYPEWCAAGFVGVQQMASEEVEALKTRDWAQYQEWLHPGAR